MSAFPISFPKSHPPELTFTPGQKDRGRIPTTSESLTFLTAAAIQKAGTDQFGGSNEQITANYLIVSKYFAQLFQSQFLIGYAIPGQNTTTIKAENIRLVNLEIREMALNAKKTILEALNGIRRDSFHAITRSQIEELMDLPVEVWKTHKSFKDVDGSKSSKERNKEIQKFLTLDIESLKQHYRVFGIRQGQTNLKSNFSHSSCIIGGFAEHVENIWGHHVKVGDFLSIILRHDSDGIPEFVPCVSSTPTPPRDLLVGRDLTGHRSEGTFFPVAQVLQILTDVEVTKDETEMREIQGLAIPQISRDYIAPAAGNLNIRVLIEPPKL